MSALWTSVWPFTVAMMNIAGIVFGFVLAIEAVSFVINVIISTIKKMRN